MARFDGVFIFLAVVLALGYLVARPHLGTVYVEEIRHLTGGKPWVHYDEFGSEARCREDAKEARNSAPEAARVTRVFFSYRCRAEVRFLWGW